GCADLVGGGAPPPGAGNDGPVPPVGGAAPDGGAPPPGDSGAPRSPCPGPRPFGVEAPFPTVGGATAGARVRILADGCAGGAGRARPGAFASPSAWSAWRRSGPSPTCSWSSG